MILTLEKKEGGDPFFFSFIDRFYVNDQPRRDVPMPNLIIPIPATYDAISRRAAKSVIAEVMRITSIDKTTRVDIMGETGQLAQPGSELGDVDNTPRFIHQGHVLVSFRETYVESEVINAEVRHPSAQPVFKDEQIGVMIKPIYSATDMELNFTYRARSKQEAMVWRDDVKVRMADNRQSHLHKLEYHIPVPNFCSALLMQIFAKREAVAGYGDTLGEYLKQHYTDRATVITNQAGNLSASLLVVNETQIGVQGWFDFDLPVEEEKSEEGPSYLIQFSYKFSYLKPVEMHVVYPQIVHNQLLDPAFLTPLPENKDPDRALTYKSEYKFALDHFDYVARIPPKPTGGLHIPEYDEWLPDSIRPYTTSLVTWMVVFDPEDLYTPLTEIDILDTGFLPEFLEFLKTEGDSLVKLGHSPIHFSLYRGRTPVADGDLAVSVTDKAITIRTITPADLRQTYHVRMAFCTELTRYTDEALMRMHHNGHNTLRIFQSVVNRLDVEDALKNEMDDQGRLSISYIKRFFGFIRDQAIGHDPSHVTDRTVNNNRENDQSWYDNDWSFRFRKETPYVEVLTIIAGKE